MSNQFYNFISSKLLTYFAERPIDIGERYYLILNDFQEIQQLQEAVIEEKTFPSGIFTSEEYNFSTPSFKINNTEMIFVFVSENMTHDFLVTIRNQISNQEGIWRNKSVVFIIREDLDSITGGAYNLAKQGAPFHTNTLRENIKLLVNEDSSTNKLGLSEKVMLEYILDTRFDDEFARYTLMDFEAVYSIYQNQAITENDFKNLELFNDVQLKSFSNKEDIKERLDINRSLFEEISLYHTQGTARDNLQNIFDNNSLVNKLSRKDWQDVDFNNILKSYNSRKEQNKIKIQFDRENFNQQFNNTGIEVWERQEGTTAAKSKKFHIIINRQDKLINSIKLPFDENVNKVDVKSNNIFIPEQNFKSSLDISGKQKSIVLDFPKLNNEYFFIELKYRHKNKSNLTFSFKILVVNFSIDFLKNFKSKFLLDYNIKESIPIIKIHEYDSLLVFGEGEENEITAENIGEIYSLVDESLIVNLSSLIKEDASNIYFYLKNNNFLLKIELATPLNSPIPRSSQFLFKKIYDKGISMIWDGKILIQDTDEYYVYDNFKQYLNIESQIIENNILFPVMTDGNISDAHLSINSEIKSAYYKFFELLKYQKTLPSLTAFEDNIYDAANHICELTLNIINSVQEDTRVIESIQNILDIGKIRLDDKLVFTLLNPFVLQFEIEKYKTFRHQENSEKIISKYKSTNLVPFYLENNNYYFSDTDDFFPKSIVFKNYKSHNNLQGSTLESIVKSRISDFKKHFEYLFISNPKLPIKVKFKNIYEYKYIFKGVINYILGQADSSIGKPEEITPINIYLDSEFNINESINIFNIDSLDTLIEELNITVKPSLKKFYDNLDLLNIIKKNINIFVDSHESNFHVTFYNFNQKPVFSIFESDLLNCSFANKGLISSNSVHTKMGTNYVTGFGFKSIEGFTSKIIDFSKAWNSLIVTNKDNRLQTFKKNTSIVNNISEIDSQNLDFMFSNSNWVTFIDPNINLSYFDDYNSPLYIIHYSDQTSSLNYESITVTNKTEEYRHVLIEYLEKVNSSYRPENIENVIRSFNTLNGEWLLKIIGQKKLHDNFVREKLSIISAYKNVMSLLDNDDIVWVPISLEEILRVSRLQGISNESDLFSSRELGYSGATSDDLLFIGVELTENQYNVHFVPVEVKIGLNKNNVTSKAKNQLYNTFNIFKDQLITESDNKATQEFFRFFFLNLYFSNLEKFINNKLVNENKYQDILNLKSQILNSENIYSTSLNDKYFSGISVLFTTNNYFRKITKRSGKPILELQLNEQDGYTDAEKDYSDVLNEWNNQTRGLDHSYFLKNYLPMQKFQKQDNSNTIYKIHNQDSDKLKVADSSTTSNELYNQKSIDIKETAINDEDELNLDSTIKKEEKNMDTQGANQDTKYNNNESKEDINLTDYSTVNNTVTHDIRLLLGRILGTTEDFYWEYGNKKLGNRHLLITGKSGQGKTYFLQTLLYELSKNNLDSLVIDYTDSFLGSQLEDSLKDKMNEKIHSRFVIQEKIPLNPFKKNNIELDEGIYHPESNQDVAERVIQILDFVFNLGVQQNYKLKEVLLECLAIYDENLTFTIIKNKLMDAEETTLLGRLTSLLDRDPFNYSQSDNEWRNYFNGEGKLNVLQLKGYPNNIQQVIVEFILWDIYNYTTINGNKNMVFPVLLDEMQNLNHKSNSPTGKIMREGRKFGWSTWLATQSLSSLQTGNSDVSHIYNAATQIHFSPPENQVKEISKLLSSDNQKRKEWESRLSLLQKGECVVSGYVKVNEELKKTTEIIKITSLEER